MAMPRINAETREIGGKRTNHKLRQKGFVPGVLYGHNKDTKTIKVDHIELEKLLSKHGESGTINVQLDGEPKAAIIKEVQRGVIKNEILHVDFQELAEGETVKMHIPVHLTGKESVESATTIVQQQINELDIQCLPKHIPQVINADVSDLEVGHSLTVADLEVLKDENIEVLNEDSEVVASLTTVNMQSDEEESEGTSILEGEGSILEE